MDIWKKNSQREAFKVVERKQNKEMKPIIIRENSIKECSVTFHSAEVLLNSQK
jgi:hypothetical protein